MNSRAVLILGLLAGLAISGFANYRGGMTMVKALQLAQEHVYKPQADTIEEYRKISQSYDQIPRWETYYEHELRWERRGWRTLWLIGLCITCACISALSTLHLRRQGQKALQRFFEESEYRARRVQDSRPAACYVVLR